MNLPEHVNETIRRLNPEVYKPFRVTEGQADPDLDDESAFHEEIIDYVKSLGVHGIVHSRCDQATTVQVGVPDLLFAFQGAPVAFEAKVKGRKPTPAQLGWLKALELDGWTVAIVRSMADVVAVLEQAKLRAGLGQVPEGHGIND